MRKLMAVGFAMATIGAMVTNARANVPAPVLASARIERRGPTIELHFGFHGAVPRLDLSAHGNQLWIDLARTHVAIPPRPLFGQEAAPIMSVRAIEADAGQSRIVVEVLGKADYAVARLPHEIVLRIASTGADPNIAAPIVVHSAAPHPNRRALA